MRDARVRPSACAGEFRKPATRSRGSTLTAGSPHLPAPTPPQDEDAALAAALAASMEEANGRPAPAAPRPSPPPTARRPQQPAASAAPKGPAGPAPTEVSLPDGTAVARRIIASDNSCLFNAVGYVMEATRSKATELRPVIARAVAADPGEQLCSFLGGRACHVWAQERRRRRRPRAAAGDRMLARSASSWRAACRRPVRPAAHAPARARAL